LGCELRSIFNLTYHPDPASLTHKGCRINTAAGAPLAAAVPAEVVLAGVLAAAVPAEVVLAGVLVAAVPAAVALAGVLVVAVPAVAVRAGLYFVSYARCDLSSTLMSSVLLC
jgi:hypothetical protein